MPPHTTGHAIGRSIRAECLSASAQLQAAGEVHTRIHEARKAIRRARSLLALVDDRLDVEAANRALERLGDSLSILRDARAAVETAARVAKRDGPGRWAPVVRALRRRAGDAARRVLDADPRFAKRAAAIQRTVGRLDTLCWEEVSPRDIRHALKRQRKRVERAAKRARKDPTADKLHRWRRRVRRLRMQLEALSQLGIEGVSVEPGQRKKLQALSDDLGWNQDLDVLARIVGRLPGLDERKALLTRLDALRPGIPS